MATAETTTTTTMPPPPYRLPSKFIDSHHHFLDTTNNDFQTFLASLVPNCQYLPENYHRDVVEPLTEKDVVFLGSVHVEAMPDDGIQEAQWVQQMCNDENNKCHVKAIVASTDLTTDNVKETLQALQEKVGDRVRGIRWILDCVGKYEPNTATHVATKRHDGIDYLRYNHHPQDSSTTTTSVYEKFERGFALLETFGFSFDLQCAPVQLPAAVQLCSKYPNIPVVIDHIGKPRALLADKIDNDNDDDDVDAILDHQEWDTWQRGMMAMAKLPHVYVKISMLGYAVPGWIETNVKRQLVKRMVQSVVSWFGPRRIMINLNWYVSGAASDGDGRSDIGPDPLTFLHYMMEFLSPHYSTEDMDWMFYKTAQTFYKIEEQN